MAAPITEQILDGMQSLTLSSQKSTDAARKENNDGTDSSRKPLNATLLDNRSTVPMPVKDSKAELQLLCQELNKKKAILGTVNVSTLPDGGARIKDQISKLQSRIASLSTLDAAAKSVVPFNNFSKSNPSSGVPHVMQMKGPNGQTMLVKVVSAPKPHSSGSEHHTNFQPSFQRPAPILSNSGQQPASFRQISGNNVPADNWRYQASSMGTQQHVQQFGNQQHSRNFGNQQHSRNFGNQPHSRNFGNQMQGSSHHGVSHGNWKMPPHAGPQQKMANFQVSQNQAFQAYRQPPQHYGAQNRPPPQYVEPIRLPPHILKQLYAAQPQAQTLYGGRMTQARRQEVQYVTKDAIEKLHAALETRPAETDELADPSALAIPLLTHQRQALAWMMWREKQQPPGGILADDMGLGKTLTVLSLILKHKETYGPAAKEETTDEDKDLIHSEATLIICPASVLHQWAKEVEDRVQKDQLRVLVYHGPNREKNLRKLAGYDVVVTTYNIILSEIGGDKKSSSTEETTPSPKNLSGLLQIIWERIVLDEGHCVKNHKSQTCQAICRLRTKRRWAVTGTPLHNKVLDLYALLRFLRCSPFDEEKVWKKEIEKNPEGEARLKTLMKSLLLRRTKDQTTSSGKPLVHLPEKKSYVYDLKLSEAEQAVYDRLFQKSRSYFMTYIKEQAAKKNANGDQVQDKDLDGAVAAAAKRPIHGSLLLVLLLRLRQCCSHLSLLTENLDRETKETEGVEEDDLLSAMSSLSLAENKAASGQESQEMGVTDVVKEIWNDKNTNKELFEKKMASTKIKALMEKLKEVSGEQDDGSRQKSVIVSQWTSMLDVVAKHLKAAGFRFHVIKGDVTAKARSVAVEDFNKNATGPQVMLISLKAGGVGLNLIGGNHLFLLDLHWNPQLESQACDRIYRVGQERTVHIHKFLCSSTIEERIVQLQEKKLQLASDILAGAKDNKMQKLTLDDMKLLFGIRGQQVQQPVTTT